MSLSTFSSFYLTFEITSDNQNINFDEGGGELLASISVGSYSLSGLLVAMKTALDSAGADTYTVTVNRSTRIITISSTGTFSLLLQTGSQVGTSPFELIGFTGTVDTGTASSHSGDSGAGVEYRNQFILQDYVGPDDFQETIDATVNEAASGALEVVSYGTRRFVEMNVMFINDFPQDGRVIKNNPNGRADAQAFMQSLIKKGPLEFMPDFANPSVFYELVLESTPESKDGVGYRLKEEIGLNLPGYFRTGVLRFRVRE